MQCNAEKTINSMRQINDFPFYTAIYYGDYKINEFKMGAIDSPLAVVPFFEDLFAKAGISITLELPTFQDIRSGCSAFFCRTPENNALVGKNLDWKRDPLLLLRTSPKNCYSSLTMVNLNFCDLFNLGALKFKLLLSPYVPLDGINECGLVVTMLSIHEGTEYPIISDKITVGDFNIIRIILDSCKDVNEAINFFKKYNIIQTGLLPLHYLIADKKKSCIVEFSNSKMNIKESKELNYLTNFIKLDNPDYDNKKMLCKRYQIIERALLKNNGVLDKLKAEKLLRIVSVFQPEYEAPSTIFSILYDIEHLKMRIRIGQERKIYTVKLASS